MFYPARGDDHSSSLGAFLLLVTAAFGLSGVAVDISAMMRSNGQRGFVPGIVIVIAGIVVYIILLYCTRVFLHRMVTTELLLIVGWTMLEIAVANAAYGYGVLDGSKLMIQLTVNSIAAIASLILYLLYYKVKPDTGYVFGMIPLITEAIAMGIFLALTR